MKSCDLRCWAEVDKSRISHNFRQIKSKSNCEILCVIKANAYGHGAVECAKILAQFDIYGFGVACMKEAIELRIAGIKNKILVLGVISKSDIPLLINYNIIPMITTFEFAKKFSEYLAKLEIKRDIHIKIDTGMSRLGFLYTPFTKSDIAIGIQNLKEFANSQIESLSKFNETLENIEKIFNLKGINIEGIATHYANSDDEDASFAKLQTTRFSCLLNLLKQRGIDIKYQSSENSGAILSQKYDFNLKRPGILLYGLYPSEFSKNNFKMDLKPAMSLKTKVAEVKTVKKDSSIGYGKKRLKKDTNIAILSIGYADGFARSFVGAWCSLNGNTCKILSVCMDQTLIDVDNLMPKVGDVATLFGESEIISIDKLAEYSGLLNYEILCNLGSRVARIFK